MARNTINYTVPADGGRDKGKVFVLTEMSAFKAELWALRVLLALTSSNVNVPEGFEKLGMAGIAELGLRMLAGLKFEVAQPLLAEMMHCVKFMPEPSKPQIVRDLMDDEVNSDIEEVATRVKLRIEVWNLHTGFLKAGVLSIFKKSKTPASGEPLQNT